MLPGLKHRRPGQVEQQLAPWLIARGIGSRYFRVSFLAHSTFLFSVLDQRWQAVGHISIRVVVAVLGPTP